MEITRTTHDCPQIHHLLQIYEKEFSPITGKTPDTQGRYALDVDLTQTNNHLCHHDGEVVGFCVKGLTGGRHDILEFYITPQMRGGNLGEALAHHIFTRYKGEWQVRQIQGADKAIKFWRKTIHNFTGGDYQEEQLEDPYWGPVTRQTFISG